MKHITTLILVVGSISSYAQILNANECILTKIGSNQEVMVCKKAALLREDTDEYYYLPTNLRFSVSKNNTIEFSFLQFSSQNNSSGAIVHFLITWGLTQNQFEEVHDKLIEIKGENAKLMGAVIPKVDNDTSGFVIEGTSKLVDVLNRSKVTIGKATPIANTKIAASFQLNQEDAKFFETALKKNGNELKNTSLTLLFYLNYSPKPYRTYKLKKNFYELLNYSL